METKEKDQASVKKYYDQEAYNYIRKYSEDYESYPTYLLRLNLALNCIKEKEIKTIVDYGCGSCGPMIKMLDEGYSIKGFDLSPEMVESGKKILKDKGYDPALVEVGDLEDNFPFADEKFDAAFAFGVFPHIKDEIAAMKKMGDMLNEGGYLYASFRNDLFAMFSMNEYTNHFLTNKLTDVEIMPGEFKDDWQKLLNENYELDLNKIKENKELEYKDIYATFHNPLTINEELIKPAGFEMTKILFHHYHLVPPKIGAKNPKLFRQLSLELEDPEDWRGYFKASTYLIEARKL